MQSLCDLAEPRQLHWNVSADVSNEIAQVAESLDRWRHYISINLRSLNSLKMTVIVRQRSNRLLISESY